MGDGTTTNSNIPIQIGSANNWQSVTGGASHTTAIKNDGTLWCWGQNTYGQLGDGTMTNSLIPIQIGSANNWQSVSGGGAHTMAIKSVGTLWGWGSNSSGQVGDGTSFNRNIPIQIGQSLTVTTSVTSNYNGSQVSCNGATDGEATAVVAGGTGTLTYSWSTTPVQTSAVATGLGAGTYTVTVTDGTSGTATSSVTITQPSQLIANITIDSIACGLTSGSALTAAESGGTSPYTYSWNNSLFTASIQYLPQGTYTVTITDANNCTANSNVSIITQPVIIATAVPSTQICFGSPLTLSGSGASSYSWTGPNAATDNVPFVPTTSGIYTVTGTDANGCSATSSISLTLLTLPTVTASTMPANGVICDGDSITFSGGGAVSYTWTGGVTDALPSSVVTTGVYTVTGTDVNGCTNTATQTVLVNALPNLSISSTPSNAVVCDGDGVTLSGSGAATLSWSGGITNNLAFVPTASGSYTLMGTDGNGCSNTVSTSVTVNPLPTVNAIANQTVCNNASTSLVSLSGSLPNTVYNWTNSDSTIGLSATGSGNIPSFTAINTGSSAKTATITVTPILELSPLTSDTFNFSGSMQSFTVPAGVDSITIEAFGAQGGANWVNNTNYGGYTRGKFAVTPGSTLQVYVGEQPNGLTGGYNGGGNGESAGKGGGGASDVRTIGGTLNDRIIVAGGGGGAGYWSSQHVVGGVGGGLNGGDGYRGVPITEGGQGGTQFGSGTGTCGSINNPITSGGFGYGGAPSVCGCEGYGGGGGWYGGAGSGNCRGGGGGSGYLLPTATDTATASGVKVGNGLVVFTYTYGSSVVSNCTGPSQTFTYTVNPDPVITATNDTICVGESGTVAASGGTSYAWDNAPTNSTTASITESPSTTASYTVIGTDNNGCASTAVATIQVDTLPTINTVGATICDGKPFTISATNGLNNYAWSGPLPTNQNSSSTNTLSLSNASTSDAGTYIVSASDANGCSNSAVANVSVNTFGGGGAPIPEILYYKFDETGTTVTNNASAPPVGTNPAVLIGTVTQGSTGMSGTALVGASSTGSDWVNTGWNTNLGTSSWTISFWSENISNSFYIFGDGSAASFRCFTNGVAGPNNWLLRGPVSDVLLPGGATIAPHINTFVYDNVAGNIKAYRDGILVNTVSQPPLNIIGTAGQFQIGTYNSNSGSKLQNGEKLDEFRIYNRALSPAEVMLLNNPSIGTGNINTLASMGTICAGDSSIVSVSSSVTPISYLWSGGVSNVNADSNIVSPVTSTTYVVTATDVNTCTAVDSITVNVNALPQTPTATTVDPICAIGLGAIDVTSPVGTNYQYRLDNQAYQTGTSFATTSGTYALRAQDTNTGCVSLPANVTLNISSVTCDPNIAVGASALPLAIQEGGTANVEYYVSNVGNYPTTDTITILITKPINGSLTLSLPVGWTVKANTAAVVLLETMNVIQPGLINRVTIPGVYMHNNTNEDALRIVNILAAPNSGGETKNDNNEGQTYIQIN